MKIGLTKRSLNFHILFFYILSRIRRNSGNITALELLSLEQLATRLFRKR
jgi:hypothetical protein